MKWKKVFLVLGMSGWLLLPGCTSRNPNYLAGDASSPPDGPSATDSRGADVRPSPDHVPWQCQTNPQCNDNLSCTVDTCGAKKVCENVLKPGSCLIGVACFLEGAVNPAESCQACVTSLSTSIWSPRPNGTACTSDNLWCTKDVCGGGKCGHVLQAGACLINNHCYADGDHNPANPCESCNSDNPSKWSSAPMVLCYEDQDGDGVGVNDNSKTFCDGCPQGWASKSGDCDDQNADVFPGQTAWFPLPYVDAANADSWDYNCTGGVEEKYPATFKCYKSGNTCTFQQGWVSTVPECGTTAMMVTSCTPSGGNCMSTAVVGLQTCH